MSGKAVREDEQISSCYGSMLPSAATVNARPGSVPLPGVSTTRTRSVSFADTPSVLAPVAFSAQVLGSLIRIRCSDPTGISENAISQRSWPIAVRADA